MNNQSQAFQVLNHLHEKGLKDLVLCPGGRSAPWLNILSEADHPFRIYSHFDERAAGFFALGLSQAMNSPVAVLTTSGTAVSETLSAVIEAHYSSTPLIILSADRPQNYRGSGAPQAIRQGELLKPYVSQVYDLEKSPLHIQGWNKKTPLHINVSFNEPLIDSSAEGLHFSAAVNFTESVTTESSLKSKPLEKAIQDFRSRVERPLMVISGSYGFDPRLVLQVLEETRIPVFFESTSGLKKNPTFKNFEVDFPERLFARKQVDGVIRVGHVPTHRFWRDLESLKLPVLNFSHHPFSGLSWSREVFELSDLFHVPLKDFRHPDLESLKELDTELQEKRRTNLLKFPESEPALIHSLHKDWAAKDLVYLGNSLPIREWDYVQEKPFQNLSCSRGANGIDGQLSTFFGRALFEKKALGVFGDLTALYDMNAPWFCKYLKGDCHIAVINNQGGMIFDRMFGGKEIYLNKHELRLEEMAGMWNLNHAVHSTDKNPFLTKSSLIEIRPNAKETHLFWESMK